MARTIQEIETIETLQLGDRKGANDTPYQALKKDPVDFAASYVIVVIGALLALVIGLPVISVVMFAIAKLLGG